MLNVDRMMGVRKGRFIFVGDRKGFIKEIGMIIWIYFCRLWGREDFLERGYSMSKGIR